MEIPIQPKNQHQVSFLIFESMPFHSIDYYMTLLFLLCSPHSSTNLGHIYSTPQTTKPPYTNKTLYKQTKHFAQHIHAQFALNTLLLRQASTFSAPKQFVWLGSPRSIGPI